MSNKNPYGHAAGAYGTTAAATDQRSLEGQVLLKAAAQLDTLATRLRNNEDISLDDIGGTIDYNRKLWTLFVSEMTNEENELPQGIKNNIASLGLFVFKRSMEVLAAPTADKLKVLIDINRNIASGLLKQVKTPSLPTTNPLSAKPQDAQHPVELSTDSLV